MCFVNRKNTHRKRTKGSKRSSKTKKLKSNGRNANKTSESDENQAKEKNYWLRQIAFLSSIILGTKLKEPNKSKAQLRTFWIFFRCGQFTFRMADCEVGGATHYCEPPPRWLLREAEGNDSNGRGSERRG
ncbi:hypothetical protein TNCV_2483221 [Trichonephila clavipes]|uniref:Uncharacterized protein n=1 Tax=Trichonephila clavipes TaxID=2585209 RepID=A0A8X7BAL9_TRICX|nr:hypothetical protein TNCV_2483221 [Trichonephila clavipes]